MYSTLTKRACTEYTQSVVPNHSLEEKLMDELKAEVGKKVWLHLRGPLILYNYSSGGNEEIPIGNYPATWVENPYPEKIAPVLLLDDLHVGGVKEYWEDKVSNNLVTITEL